MNKYYDLGELNKLLKRTMCIMESPRYYGVYIGVLKMKSQVNDKEPIKFKREYTNIARMNRDLKKYAFKLPLTTSELTFQEIIELTFILDSMVNSCEELLRLYKIKKSKKGGE